MTRNIYCLDGSQGQLLWSYKTGGYVVSSPAVGDVDSDGFYEVVVGSRDSQVYCLDGISGTLEWAFATGGEVWSSPALADRSNTSSHAKEWPMYKHDAKRSGFYGEGVGLDVYIGSEDSYLYLLDGKNGELLDRFLCNARIRALTRLLLMLMATTNWKSCSSTGLLPDTFGWKARREILCGVLKIQPRQELLIPGNLPPVGSILVNAGDPVTSTTDVTLTLSAQDDSMVDSMCFSMDGTNFSEWESYGTSKDWILTLGDGDKTVYVKYMDDTGLTSVLYSDLILLDTANNVPVVLEFKVRPKTLNLTSKGKKMLAQIKIPPDALLTPDDIDIASLEIKDQFGNSYSINFLPIGGEGSDGSNNLVMKLDRSEVSGSLLESLDWELGGGNDAEATFTVTGDLFVGTSFSGISTINLINNGKQGKGKK